DYAGDTTVRIEYDSERQPAALVAQLAHQRDALGAGEEHRVRDRHLFNETFDIGPRIARQAQEGHLGVFVMQGVEIGHLAHTGGTPAGPEIGQDGTADQRGELEILAIQALERATKEGIHGQHRRTRACADGSHADAQHQTPGPLQEFPSAVHAIHLSKHETTPFIIALGPTIQSGGSRCTYTYWGS